MGFRIHGLRAIALATLVALASVSVLIAPVAAADPAPTPASIAPVAAADPAATPAADPGSTAITPVPATVTPVAPAQVTIVATTLAPVARPSFAARVVGVALRQRNKRYVLNAAGPWAFDCSGLVWYAYHMAGVSRHLGGGHSARAMYTWARAHHLTSRSQPRLGDVVVYGFGSHVGIYIGHGRVISALNPRQGIRVTGLYALRGRFTAFIHTHL